MTEAEAMRFRRAAAREAGLRLACCKRQPMQGRGSCETCFERRKRGYAVDNAMRTLRAR